MMKTYPADGHQQPKAHIGDTGAILADYITEQQFADELNVTLRTLRTWRAAGEAPTVTRISMKVYYARDDIREWLRGRRVEAA